MERNIGEKLKYSRLLKIQNRYIESYLAKNPNAKEHWVQMGPQDSAKLSAVLEMGGFDNLNDYLMVSVNRDFYSYTSQEHAREIREEEKLKLIASRLKEVPPELRNSLEAAWKQLPLETLQQMEIFVSDDKGDDDVS